MIKQYKSIVTRFNLQGIENLPLSSVFQPFVKLLFGCDNCFIVVFRRFTFFQAYKIMTISIMYNAHSHSGVSTNTFDHYTFAWERFGWNKTKILDDNADISLFFNWIFFQNACTHQPTNYFWIPHCALWRPNLELPAMFPKHNQLLFWQRIAFDVSLHRLSCRESNKQYTTSCPDYIWYWFFDGTRTKGNKERKLK